MSHFLKLFILFSFLILTTVKVKGEEIWRLRYLVITSAETEINRNSNKTKNKLETDGNSGSLIFLNGVGLGYNSHLKKGTVEGIYYKFKNHSLDLSYTIGKFFSLTFGVGRIVYGRGELNYNGNNFVTESSRGEAYFLDLGIPFLVGEFLFGYRQNYIEYNNFQTQVSGVSLILDDNLKLSSSQFNLGLGFLF